MDNFIAPTDLVAHLAYVLMALSYLLTQIFWLRLVAIVGLMLEIIYFIITRQSFTLGLPWDMVLMLINLYAVALLLHARAQAQLPKADALLLRRAFEGLDDMQIARLLRAAEMRDFAAGDIITRQDAPVDGLYFMLTGRARMEADGRILAHLESGAFVGETAYLTGNLASARVTMEEHGRLLVFSHMRMAKAAAGDRQISGILYQALGRDLARKMRQADTRRVMER